MHSPRHQLIHPPVYIVVAALMVLGSAVGTSPCSAQDTVFLNTGRPLRGAVKNSNPEELLVGSKTVSAQDVKKVNFSGAPRELGRAKEDMLNGRYTDAWAELEKIDPVPTDPMVLQEYEYARSVTMGKIALMGGQISTREAGAKIGAFVRKYPDSFRIYPVLDIYGQLLVGINRIDLAEAEFRKLAASNWPEFQLKGLFDLGQAQLLMEKYPEATASFNKLESHSLNDAVAQQYKLLAKCQNAKSMAMQGKPDQAKAALEQIILNQDHQNKQLFARCYNALGTCYLQKDEPLEAAMAFLHTDLLYSGDTDAHAEALYQLAQIWPQLEDTDRANRARQLLSGSYSSSFWKLKLDKGN